MNLIIIGSENAGLVSGTCFPKDVKVLKKIAEEHAYDAELISVVENVNNRQKFVVSNKEIKRFGENLSGKVFGIWVCLLNLVPAI